MTMLGFPMSYAHGSLWFLEGFLLSTALSPGYPSVFFPKITHGFNILWWPQLLITNWSVTDYLWSIFPSWNYSLTHHVFSDSPVKSMWVRTISFLTIFWTVAGSKWGSSVRSNKRSYLNSAFTFKCLFSLPLSMFVISTTSSLLWAKCPIALTKLAGALFLLFYYNNSSAHTIINGKYPTVCYYNHI